MECGEHRTLLQGEFDSYLTLYIAEQCVECNIRNTRGPSYMKLPSRRKDEYNDQ
jgi:hypothetical protein